jgi:CheY-like chemotaxis protein
MRVYLPTSQTAEHYYRPEAKTELKGGSESILIVDDEEPLARMIGKTLTRLGYRVTVKTSSIEALELIRQSPDMFDLVVSDQTMPGMTGDRLAEEIRKIRPDIPIILCSGFSEILTPEREQAIKVSKLVRKPFMGDELEREIRRALDSKAAPGKDSDLKSSS